MNNSIQVVIPNKQLLSGGLYIVATPIGNLKDITLRALEILQNATVILCEDTRITHKLLSHYGIKASMIVYNDHSAPKIRPKILQKLENGEAIALVSDAGTPLISDPGFQLVKEVISKSIYCTTLPGASSVLTALTLAALPTDKFFFAGFLPPKKQARENALKEFSTINATSIFLERSTRIIEMLESIANVFGNRDGVIARELTKSFEEVIRKPVMEILKQYQEHSLPKGELVVLIAPPNKAVCSDEKLDKYLGELLKVMTFKEAVSIAADQLNIQKKKAYTHALSMKKILDIKNL